jgi:hypothetical protein
MWAFDDFRGTQAHVPGWPDHAWRSSPNPYSVFSDLASSILGAAVAKTSVANATVFISFSSAFLFLIWTRPATVEGGLKRIHTC